MTFEEYKQAKVHLERCLKAIGNKNPNPIQMQIVEKLKDLIKEYEERKLH